MSRPVRPRTIEQWRMEKDRIRRIAIAISMDPLLEEGWRIDTIDKLLEIQRRIDPDHPESPLNPRRTREDRHKAPASKAEVNVEGGVT